MSEGPVTNDQTPKGAALPEGVKFYPGVTMAPRREAPGGTPSAAAGTAALHGRIGALHPGHKGSREDVVKAIQMDRGLAEHHRVFILGEIAAIEGKAVQVSFHPIAMKDHCVGSWHVKKIF
jgi:hypothetical protein